MVIQLLQNAALLALTAIAVFAIEDRAWLQARPRARAAAIGLALGGIAVLVSSVGVHLPDGLQIDANAGPLMLAGAIGGPLAGLLAAAPGVATHLVAGSGMPWLAATGYAMYAAIGALLHAPPPPRAPARLPARRIALMVLLGCAGAAALWLIAVPRADPGTRPGDVLPPILLANALSAALTGAVAAAALRAAAVAAENARLREWLQLGARTAGVGVYEYDPVRERMTWDDTLCAIYGVTPGSFDGTCGSWLAMVHPEDRATLETEIAASHTGKKDVTAEFRIVRPNGEIRHLRACALPVHDGQGRFLRTIGTNQDITALRDSEVQRLAAEREFAALGRSAPGVVLRYRLAPERGARIEATGAGSGEIRGLVPERITGDAGRFWALVPEDQRAAARGSLEAALREGRPWLHGFALDTGAGDAPDGRRWVQARGNVAREPGGDAAMTLLLIDVTAQRRTEAALAESRELFHQAQKREALGRLSGGIAHDFNNLLAVILGNVEMALESAGDTDAQPYLEDARTQIRKGGELTRQLLGFTRNAPLKPQVLDVGAVLSGMGSLLARTLPARIAVDIHAAPDMAHARLDRTGLENAILNLALNARDAMPEGGRLTLTLEKVPPADGHDGADARAQVRIEVSDTGAGMTPEVAEHAANPYFTTKPPGAGSGLGLSMVEGFADQSGGSVAIDTAPGRGTTVALLFPATDSAAEPSAPAPAPGGTLPGGRERLLLAEDDDALRGLLTRQLRALGYRVAAAPNGADALALFEADPGFDLLLSDIVMPGDLQGPALAAALCARRPDLPVVFMTGYAGDGGAGAADLGGAPCLQKPVGIATLARALRDRLDQRDQGP